MGSSDRLVVEIHGAARFGNGSLRDGAATLRSLSQGRASNSMQFSHFSAVDQPTRERLYPLFTGKPQ